jgi:hypothetical protein
MLRSLSAATRTVLRLTQAQPDQDAVEVSAESRVRFDDILPSQQSAESLFREIGDCAVVCAEHTPRFTFSCSNSFNSLTPRFAGPLYIRASTRLG